MSLFKNRNINWAWVGVSLIFVFSLAWAITKLVSNARQDEPESTSGENWLLIPVVDGIQLVSADGNEKQTISADYGDILHVFPGRHISNRFLAILSRDSGSEDRNSRQISIVDLIDKRNIDRFDLISDQWEFTSVGDSSNPIPAISLANETWSNDDLYFYFVAAIDTPNGELYRYSIEHRIVERLTNGVGHITQLSLSNNQKWIAYQRIENFGTGAGRLSAGVEILNLESNEIVFHGFSREDQIIVGWTSDGDLIVYPSLSVPNDKLDFFTFNAVNPSTGEITTLYEHEFFKMRGIEAEIIKEDSIAVMIETQDDRRNTNISIYQFTQLDKQWESKEITIGGLTSVPWADLSLDRNGTFYLPMSQGITAIYSDGKQIEFPGETNPPKYNLSDGDLLVFFARNNNPGLRLYSANGDLTREISDEPVVDVLWSEDGNLIAFTTESDLYIYHNGTANIYPILMGENPYDPTDLGRTIVWVY